MVCVKCSRGVSAVVGITDGLGGEFRWYCHPCAGVVGNAPPIDPAAELRVCESSARTAVENIAAQLGWSRVLELLSMAARSARPK